MQKQLTYDDLESSGILNEIVTELTRFSIGFVKFVEKNGKEDMILAGSGTLVQAQDHFGILTADHVLQNLTGTYFGIILPALGQNSPHRITVDIDHIQKLRIGPASNSASGPDLGLCILSFSDKSILETWSAFYNISKRRERVLQDLKSIEDGGWFLCGAPNEWTSETTPERVFTKINAFRGFCGAAVVTTERVFSDFDYLDVDIAPRGRYDGPLNYQGVSGGRLWQVVLKMRDERIQIVDCLLSGVAFYQVIENNLPQTIVCHGRRSVYESLFRRMPRTS